MFLHPWEWQRVMRNSPGGSRRSTEMKLCPNLARMSLINLFLACCFLLIRREGGWSLGCPHAARERIPAGAEVCLHAAGKVNTSEGNRNRTATYCTCVKMRNSSNGNHLPCAVHQSQAAAPTLSLPRVLVSFPRSVLFSRPGCSGGWQQSLCHAGQRDVDNVCALVTLQRFPSKGHHSP